MTNNAINVATKYIPFFLNSRDQHLVLSVFMYGGGVSGQLHSMQTMVDQMKTALEEVQANPTIARSRAKSQVDHSQYNKTLEVGDGWPSPHAISA